MLLGSRRKKSIKKFLNLHFLSYTNIMHLIRKLRTSEVRSARLQWQKLHARPPEMQPNALNVRGGMSKSANIGTPLKI